MRSVDGVSFTVNDGETLGIVGESGCGKSVTALSILRLVPVPPGRHAGAVRYRGRDLLALTEKEMRAIRGDRISMIFQEPMTSLNPVLSVGRQIAECVQLHQRLGRAEAMQRAVEMLKLVQIPEAERRAARVSAPALGRHAAAGDDRARPVVQARAADRRRADHRARRHRSRRRSSTSSSACSASSAWA